MLSQKAIEKIEVIDNEKADIYIKKEFSNKPFFKEVMKPIRGRDVVSGPHYTLTIGSITIKNI